MDESTGEACPYYSGFRKQPDYAVGMFESSGREESESEVWSAIGIFVENFCSYKEVIRSDQLASA